MSSPKINLDTARQNKLVSKEEWLSQRLTLLQSEKELKQKMDALAEQRRQLPLVKVDRDYRFQSEEGEKTLEQLFSGHQQLIVYHLMFGEDWEQGCPSCSFWADNFNGIDTHLSARNTKLVAVSNAPLEKLLAFKKRLGWSFDWVSAVDTQFGEDFGVTFPQVDSATASGEATKIYNYTQETRGSEMPGASVFIRLNETENEPGGIAHSYSTYARGIETFNGTYHLLDLTPMGRNEGELSYPMAWVKRNDEY